MEDRFGYLKDKIMPDYYPLFIDGKSWESNSRQKVINPCTAEPFAQVALADEACVETVLSCARQAFDKGPWKDISLAERKGFLLKVAQGILDSAGELARLETLNTGKPIKESTFMDVPSAAKTFEYFANNLEAYLRQETINVLPQVHSKLQRQPQGVVVLIVPWNYPLIIASWKLAQALAAGNTVILKPSSLTPLTALELARIIREAGLPGGVVNIINGSGGQIGELLCTDKRVDMISFTGSNEVGKQIVGYAARQTKKLVMELGGKSAGVILKDADLELAVNGSLCSIFLNQGQMCT
ncbi:MAG: aldehyde dehydrogenase family protein, partial [Candidatus Omnitrophica bacterium]|nr:aldehyde dehydrogenase family protein [Candidatus Omnitrophota bacterium]